MEKIDGVEAIRQSIDNYFKKQFAMEEQNYKNHLPLKNLKKNYAENLYKMGMITIPPERLSIESITFKIFGSDNYSKDESIITYSGKNIDENMTISEIEQSIKEVKHCESVLCTSISFSEKPLEDQKIISLKFKYGDDENA